MVTDIHGFIECRGVFSAESAGWIAAMSLDLVGLDSDYDAFGSLFGVRNLAAFAPVAAGRGLPVDATETTRAQFREPDCHGSTWISWSEVQAIDADEPAMAVDSRIHRHERDPAGDWRYVGKAGWSRRFAEISGDADQDGGRWPEGTEWRAGDTLFRVDRLRRRDAMPPDGQWTRLWAVMAILASVHGDENVRLVVWFDG